MVSPSGLKMRFATIGMVWKVRGESLRGFNDFLRGLPVFASHSWTVPFRCAAVAIMVPSGL